MELKTLNDNLQQRIETNLEGAAQGVRKALDKLKEMATVIATLEGECDALKGHLTEVETENSMLAEELEAHEDILVQQADQEFRERLIKAASPTPIATWESLKAADRIFREAEALREHLIKVYGPGG